MKKALILLCISLLAACSRAPVEVRIPVPVPCAPPNLPAEPETVGNRLTGNAEGDIGIVAASALRLRQWGRELHALLLACQAPTESPPQ